MGDAYSLLQALPTGSRRHSRLGNLRYFRFTQGSKNWLSGMDSNHDKGLQRALCYHYTTGQTAPKLAFCNRERKEKLPFWRTEAPLDRPTGPFPLSDFSFLFSAFRFPPRPFKGFQRKTFRPAGNDQNATN